jgi:hypothetical protein
MKTIRLLTAALALSSSLLCFPAISTGADAKPAKKLTCCEQAAANNKDCANKCCIAAHKAGKSCTKCNPNQEDLKVKKPKSPTQGQVPKPN